MKRLPRSRERSRPPPLVPDAAVRAQPADQRHRLAAACTARGLLLVRRATGAIAGGGRQPCFTWNRRIGFGRRRHRLRAPAPGEPVLRSAVAARISAALARYFRPPSRCIAQLASGLCLWAARSYRLARRSLQRRCSAQLPAAAFTISLMRTSALAPQRFRVDASWTHLLVLCRN